MTKVSKKEQFKKNQPIVSEVVRLVNDSMSKLGISTYSQLGAYLSVGGKSIERWLRFVESDKEKSSITFHYYVMLKAIADGEVVIDQYRKRISVPQELIMNYITYKPPAKFNVLKLIGLRSISKMAIKDIAYEIGVASNSLRQKVADEDISFPAWCLILLYFKVPIKDIFPKNKDIK